MLAALVPLAVAAALMADARLVLAQAAVHTAQALTVLGAPAASGSAVMMLQLKVLVEMGIAADPATVAAAVAQMHSVTAFAVVTGAQTAACLYKPGSSLQKVNKQWSLLLWCLEETRLGLWLQPDHVYLSCNDQPQMNSTALCCTTQRLARIQKEPRVCC